MAWISVSVNGSPPVPSARGGLAAAAGLEVIPPLTTQKRRNAHIAEPAAHRVRRVGLGQLIPVFTKFVHPQLAQQPVPPPFAELLEAAFHRVADLLDALPPQAPRLSVCRALLHGLANAWDAGRGCADDAVRVPLRDEGRGGIPGGEVERPPHWLAGGGTGGGYRAAAAAGGRQAM